MSELKKTENSGIPTLPAQANKTYIKAHVSTHLNWATGVSFRLLSRQDQGSHLIRYNG